MQKLGGIITLTADGQGMPISGEFKIQLGGVSSTLVIGQDGVIHGWTDEVKPGVIMGNLLVTKDIDPVEITSMQDGTIQLELAPNFMFHLKGAIFVGDKEIDTKSGQLAVRWEGLGNYVKL